MRGLEAILRPGSVAVIGASADPDRISGRPVRYLKAAGFPGRILPVNPKYATLQDLPCFPDIAAIPGAIGCAVIALPAAAATVAVEACAARGDVGAAIVFAGGFAELGAEGRALQHRMAAAAARAGGMRLLGPNCLGAFSSAARFHGTFTTVLERGFPQPNGLAIASQSGAAAGHLYSIAAQRGLGLSHWISTGNEADVELGECLRWLADDPETKVILLFAEGVRDRDSLVAGLEHARAARKPVVVFKVGRSAAGIEAAASHTAALAGADAAYEGMLAQFGALRAVSLEQAVDFAEAALGGRFPERGNFCALSISGGIGVHVADLAAEHGLSLPPLPEAAQAVARKAVPIIAGARNPIDLTAQAAADPAANARLIEGVLGASDAYDAVLAYFTNSPAMRPGPSVLRAALCGIPRRHPGRVMVMASMAEPEVAAELRAGGWLVAPDPTRAVAALGALARLGRGFARRPDPAPALPDSVPPIPRRALAEHEAKAILAAAGIPVLPERLATSAEEAAEAARLLGFPVAMKIASPDIAHKAEIGGVALGIADMAAAAAAHRALLARAAAARPEARLLGTLVVPMAPRGAGAVELILGAHNDPALGPVVMVGLGGVLVEALGDVAFRLAPFGVDEAHRMLDSLRGRRVLDGVRAAPPADVDAAATALTRLSALAAARRAEFASIDVNPLLVLPRGTASGGVLALDALIVTGRD